MKSQEIKLTNNLSCAVDALQMVETTAAAAGFTREQVNILRLLTEEMISMTTDILKTCQGTLWLECEHGACALHLTAMAPIEADAKAAFIYIPHRSTKTNSKSRTRKEQESYRGNKPLHTNLH